MSAYGWAASNIHWNKLSPDLQKVVVDVYKELEDRLDSVWLPGSTWVPPDNAEIDKIIKDYSITIIELPSEDQARIQTLADRQMAEFLVKGSDLVRRLFKSDVTALKRPERYDKLMELGKQIVK